MIHRNVELHNVVEVESREFYPGVGLHRFPASVRNALGKRGKLVSRQSSGCEIRFVSDSPQVCVSLSSFDSNGEALVFYGDIFHSKHSLIQGTIHTILLEKPVELENMNAKVWSHANFSLGVWRVMTGRYHAVFHGVDTFGGDCRPPSASELPRLRWLAYGSSITHSAHATHQANTYVSQTAMRLGLDVLNGGLSGACLCEREVADYLSEREDWDIATLEIGVNMRSGFSTEQFRKRADYLIERMVNKAPGKPVVLITSFPNAASVELNPSDSGKNQHEFNHILRELASCYTNVHLFEGSDILSSYSGLTYDMIHPSDYGHALMAENLSRLLRPVLPV
ncbi:GDSL-type esterase/lipase family protein [Paenibacillus sp. HWE-109]|uniref:GDSL-type esterase/lipase family protein n=1 Tax=Paenibacillus sp. HWE-109 TaxID=1306526 RepID=UPI001EDEF842|nr:GDSL-type esterase/lipase family protein [Paenibacillus sp. HWE-109]UKS27898.1 GDSL-type esterase/lipase family protein [Paenibacillus sp. HWE-109]